MTAAAVTIFDSVAVVDIAIAFDIRVVTADVDIVVTTWCCCRCC